jgi:L-threonylcarbamoyladenylate synthase
MKEQAYMKASIGTDFYQAKDILKAGGLVAIPTETVYGLAGNALDKNAVLSIFEAKNRPKFDPLIVHIGDIAEVDKYAKANNKLLDIADRVWPGPLTILLARKNIIPDIVTSGLENVAIRVPNHPDTLALLRSLDFPLAAPSANPFGYISPTTAMHVYEQLADKIPYIFDGGACEVGVESTIIGFEDEVLKVYRNGGLTLEELAKFYDGKIELVAQSSSDPLAPGMLKKHYSPNKIVRDFKDFQIDEIDLNSIGIMKFSSYSSEIPPERQYILSKNEYLAEASHRLFEGLRYLDKLDIETIFLENVPNMGLGLAINDRLKRAAAED